MNAPIECPVCTLYLRAGMNLEEHLYTHPMENVIKALVSVALKGACSDSDAGASTIFSCVVLGGNGGNAVTSGNSSGIIVAGSSKTNTGAPTATTLLGDTMALEVASSNPVASTLRNTARASPNAIMYDAQTTVGYAATAPARTTLLTASETGSSVSIPPHLTTVNSNMNSNSSNTIAVMKTCEVSGVTTLSHYPVNNVTIVKRELLHQPPQVGSSTSLVGYIPPEPMTTVTNSMEPCLEVSGAAGTGPVIVGCPLGAPPSAGTISIFPRYTNELYSGPPPPYSTAISSSVVTNTQIMPQPAPEGAIIGKLASTSGKCSTTVRNTAAGYSASVTLLPLTSATPVMVDSIEESEGLNKSVVACSVAPTGIGSSSAFKLPSTTGQQQRACLENLHTEKGNRDGDFLVLERSKKVVEYRENEKGELTLYEKIIKSPPWTAKVEHSEQVELEQAHQNQHCQEQQFQLLVERPPLAGRMGSSELTDTNNGTTNWSSTDASLLPAPSGRGLYGEPSLIISTSSTTNNSCSASLLTSSSVKGALSSDMSPTATVSATSTTLSTISTSTTTISAPVRKRPANGLKVLSNVKVTTDLSQGIKDIILNLNSRNVSSGVGGKNALIAASSSSSSSVASRSGSSGATTPFRLTLGEERTMVSCAKELLIRPANKMQLINFANVQDVEIINDDEEKEPEDASNGLEGEEEEEVQEVEEDEEEKETEGLQNDNERENDRYNDVKDAPVGLKRPSYYVTGNDCYSGSLGVNEVSPLPPTPMSDEPPVSSSSAVLTSVIRMTAHPSSPSPGAAPAGTPTVQPEPLSMSEGYSKEKTTVTDAVDGQRLAFDSPDGVNRKLLFFPLQVTPGKSTTCSLKVTPRTEPKLTTDPAQQTPPTASTGGLPSVYCHTVGASQLEHTPGTASSGRCQPAAPATSNRMVSDYRRPIVFRQPKKLSIKLIRPLPTGNGGTGSLDVDVSPVTNDRKRSSPQTAALGANEHVPRSMVTTTPPPTVSTNSIAVVVQKTSQDASGVGGGRITNKANFSLLTENDGCTSIEQQALHPLKIKHEYPLDGALNSNISTINSSSGSTSNSSSNSNSSSSNSNSNSNNNQRLATLICTERSPMDALYDFSPEPAVNRPPEPRTYPSAATAAATAAAAVEAAPLKEGRVHRRQSLISDINFSDYHITYIGENGETIYEPLHKTDRPSVGGVGVLDEDDDATTDSKASMAELIRVARQEFGCGKTDNSGERASKAREAKEEIDRKDSICTLVGSPVIEGGRPFQQQVVKLELNDALRTVETKVTEPPTPESSNIGDKESNMGLGTRSLLDTPTTPLKVGLPHRPSRRTSQQRHSSEEKDLLEAGPSRVALTNDQQYGDDNNNDNDDHAYGNGEQQQRPQDNADSMTKATLDARSRSRSPLVAADEKKDGLPTKPPSIQTTVGEVMNSHDGGKKLPYGIRMVLERMPKGRTIYWYDGRPSLTRRVTRPMRPRPGFDQKDLLEAGPSQMPGGSEPSKTQPQCVTQRESTSGNSIDSDGIKQAEALVADAAPFSANNYTFDPPTPSWVQKLTPHYVKAMLLAHGETNDGATEEPAARSHGDDGDDLENSSLYLEGGGASSSSSCTAKRARIHSPLEATSVACAVDASVVCDTNSNSPALPGSGGGTTGRVCSRPSSSALSSASSTSSSNLERALSTESLNIRTDEKMPAKGEISEQESNGDMDVMSWNRLYAVEENIPIYPSSYDLSTAQECWNLSNRNKHAAYESGLLHHSSQHHSSVAGGADTGSGSNSTKQYPMSHGMGFQFAVQQHQSYLQQSTDGLGDCSGVANQMEPEGTEDEQDDRNERARMKCMKVELTLDDMGTSLHQQQQKPQNNHLHFSRPHEALVKPEASGSGVSYFGCEPLLEQPSPTMDTVREAERFTKGSGALRTYRCVQCLQRFTSIEERRLHTKTEHPPGQRQQLLQQQCASATLMEQSSPTADTVRDAERSSKGCGTLRTYRCVQCLQRFTSNEERRLHMKTEHPPGQRQQLLQQQPMEDSKEGIIDSITMAAGSSSGKATVAHSYEVSVPVVMNYTWLKQEIQRKSEAAAIANAASGTIMKTTATAGGEDSKADVMNSAGFLMGGGASVAGTQVAARRRTYICDTCKQEFQRFNQFDAHLMEHPAECDCGRMFKQWRNFCLHLKRHLGIKEHQCPICCKRFVIKQKLVEHVRIHSGVAPIKCHQCGLHFKRFSNLAQHRNRHHLNRLVAKKDYVCPQCGEVFHTYAKMQWHKEIHEKRPKSCPYCREKFVHQNSLTRHIRLSHTEEYAKQQLKTEPCTICSQPYTKTSMRRHMETHTDERMAYACSICNKRFTTNWNLKQHKWTHANPTMKPYQCTLCPSGFVRPSDYATHMNAHRSVRPYTCNHCGQQFIRKYNWIRHTREHEREKIHNCDVCGRKFHRKYYLTEHKRIHTGERPFSCNICGKTSATKTNHNKHVRIHHARDPLTAEG